MKKRLIAAGLGGVILASGIGAATAGAATAGSAPAPQAPQFQAPANPTKVQVHAHADVNSPVGGDYQLTPADFAKLHVACPGGQFVQVAGGWALLPF